MIAGIVEHVALFFYVGEEVLALGQLDVQELDVVSNYTNVGAQFEGVAFFCGFVPLRRIAGGFLVGGYYEDVVIGYMAALSVGGKVLLFFVVAASIAAVEDYHLRGG